MLFDAHKNGAMISYMDLDYGRDLDKMKSTPGYTFIIAMDV